MSRKERATRAGEGRAREIGLGEGRSGEKKQREGKTMRKTRATRSPIAETPRVAIAATHSVDRMPSNSKASLPRTPMTKKRIKDLWANDLQQ